MPEPTSVPVAPPEVVAFLTKSKVPRARAIKKLEDVLRRLASNDPALGRVREVWVYGSFARGALNVGDVDLHMLVDDDRDAQRFMLDAFYGHGRPFAAEIKALGCSGSSIVSVQAHPVFREPTEPASPERLASLGGDTPAGLTPVQAPVLRHVVTNEPLAGPFVLLWARGDRLEWALSRLHGIREDPDAGRHERTTTIPLLDDLTPKLGLETSFLIAAQLHKGTVACRAFVLPPARAPEAAARVLEERYELRYRKTPSARASAAAAALRRLTEEGTDLSEVCLVDTSVIDGASANRVFVDFNPFQLYRAASGGSYQSGDRLWQIWPTSTRGPWLAFELTLLDEPGARKLYRWLTHGGGPDERGSRMLQALGLDAS